MPKLNQLLGIEKGVKADAEQMETKLHNLTQKPDLFVGIARHYRPSNDEGDRLPSQQKKVQVTAEQVLVELGKNLTRLFDVTATKDWGNTQAKADVYLDGEVFLKDVPTTYLLFLEKRLGTLAAFVSRMPVLDPGRDWEPGDGEGIYQTSAVDTTRTKKVKKSVVLYEATEHHPAQIDKFDEDVIEGFWSTIDFSGALPAIRVKELYDRVRKLQSAVKYAREEANIFDAADQKVGNKIFSYLFS